MPSFQDLKMETYYLIQVDAESDIEIVSVVMQTKEAILLRSYLPSSEDFFKLKGESLFKIIEEIDAQTAQAFEQIYAEEEAMEEELFEFEQEEEED